MCVQRSARGQVRGVNKFACGCAVCSCNVCKFSFAPVQRLRAVSLCCVVFDTTAK